MALTSATRRRRLIIQDQDDSEVSADRESKGKAVCCSRAKCRIAAHGGWILLPRWLACRWVSHNVREWSLRRERSIHGTVHARIAFCGELAPRREERLTRYRRVWVVPHIRLNGAEGAEHPDTNARGEAGI